MILTDNQRTILKSFQYGIRPDGKFDITQWCKDNVPLLNSKKASYVDLTQSPWLTEPLQSIIDGDYEHTNCVMATGSGKSTLATVLAVYSILEQPKQVAYFFPTDPLAAVYMEGSLMPSITKNPKTKALFPSNRHAIKRDVIYFNHMTMFCRGQAISNTQSISIDLALVDEAWLAKNDALSFIQRRLHDRPFSQSVFVSQAGNTSSEFSDWCKDTITKEYHYKCPSCGNYHPWRLENLKWSDDFTDVYYQCECGEQFKDTPQNRRAFSSSGKYIELPNPKANRKHITYIFNAGLNQSVEWEKLAREAVKAFADAKKYDFEKLKVLKTQRLAQWWSDEEIEYAPIQRAGYSINDKVKLSRTYMAVDCQGVPGAYYFYYSIMTFNDDGSGRLIDVGMLATYQGIVDKQKEWGLMPNQVIIDAAYNTDSVKDFCGQFGYLATNGVTTTVFPVTVNGKLVNRIHGKMKAEKTLSGKMCTYSPYSSQRAKTICAGLRSSGRWEIPHDLPETYIKQLNAERFENGIWKQLNPNNHLTDLFCMTLIIAIIHKLPIDTGDEE